jgi:hypothetical protein
MKIFNQAVNQRVQLKHDNLLNWPCENGVKAKVAVRGFSESTAQQEGKQ